MCNLTETVYMTPFQLMTNKGQNNPKSTTFLEHTELRPNIRRKSFKVSPITACCILAALLSLHWRLWHFSYRLSEWLCKNLSTEKGSTKGHALNTYSEQCELNQSLNKLAQVQKRLGMRCYRKKNSIEREKSVKETLIYTRKKPNQNTCHSPYLACSHICIWSLNKTCAPLKSTSCTESAIVGWKAASKSYF